MSDCLNQVFGIRKRGGHEVEIDGDPVAFLEGESGPAGKIEIGVGEDLRDRTIGRDQHGLGTLPTRRHAGQF